MGKSSLEEQLRKLEELELQINESSDLDPDELMKNINEIIDDISEDAQMGANKNSLSATLKYINKSNNPDPEFAHEGDSGFDLRADVKFDPSIPVSSGDTCNSVIIVHPWEVRTIPTGLYFEVAKGLEVQVRPRSGLAGDYHVTILNTPGTIDSRYRGEVGVILINLGTKDFVVHHGDRIAQGVVCPVYGEGRLSMVKVEKLSETIRSSNGFGSTGSK